MAGIHGNMIKSMFSRVKFFKSGQVIKNQAEAKAKQITAKIAERQDRIRKLREDYKITDADMIELLSDQARVRLATVGSYSLSSNAPMPRAKDEPERLIPAGLVNNLNTERALIEQEKEQVSRLELIARNIDVNLSHEIDFEELEYLGL